MRTTTTRRTALFTLMALVLATSSAFALESGAWSLAVGATRAIPAASLRSYSLSPSGIVQLHVGPHGDLILQGTRAGTTRLLLIERDGSRRTLEITVR